MGECDVRVQFCFAHLIRDVRFLTTLPDKATKNYGQRVLDAIKGLFDVIHREEKMEDARFRLALDDARREVMRKIRAALARSEARNIANRFKENPEAYFDFDAGD